MRSRRNVVGIKWDGRIVGKNKRLMIGRAVRGRKRRLILTPEYRAFKDALIWTCRAAYQGKPLNGAVDVVLQFWMGNFDIDAPIVACLDALQAGGILTSDRQVITMSVAKMQRKKAKVDKIEIDVREYGVAAG